MPLLKQNTNGLRLVLLALFALLAILSFHHTLQSSAFSTVLTRPLMTTMDALAVPPASLTAVQDLADYFSDYPIGPPYKEAFGELGRRSRVLRNWLVQVERLPQESEARARLSEAIESVAASHYPFLQRPPRRPESTTPLADLRRSFEPGSAGLVIAAGDSTARYAAQLIHNVRSVLKTTLPIQVAYAGDKDLSPASRGRIERACGGVNASGIEFLDVNDLFDGTTLRLGSASGGWALKSFAALGSRFETVILLDADAVFVQRPEALLTQDEFLETGTMLFRDRLLWQHRFTDRHQWYHDQIRRPSAALNTSLVWTEEWGEEGESGVVVVDKSRVDVFVGMLHVCWQNTYDVRENVTYKLMYGDKESWWLGFELAGTPYALEAHYGAIVGWQQPGLVVAPGQEGTSTGGDRVCSFVIAHIDKHGRVLWYNGSLLKNKARNAYEYAVPDKWMVDGTWQRGPTKNHMSCMSGSEIHNLTRTETETLRASIEEAKLVDGHF